MIRQCAIMSFVALVPIAIAAPAPLQAQPNERPPAVAPATSPGSLAARPPGAWRASLLIGMRVHGPGGEEIGEIEDLLVTPDGRVAAAVVEVGGFLGLGEREIAAPIEALRFELTDIDWGGPVPDTAGPVTAARIPVDRPDLPNRVVLMMSPDQLRAAPPWDEAGRRGGAGPIGAGAPSR